MKPFPPCREFFHSLIDYAGMFPPARLDFRSALENYQQYLKEADSWMLGNFVIATGVFADLNSEVGEAFSPDTPLRIATLVNDCTTDFQAISKKVGLVSKNLKLCAIEVKASSESSLSDQLAPIPSDPLWSECQFFFEFPLQHIEGQRLDSLLKEIIHYREASNYFCGLKLRCGGEDASLIPNSRTVATVLWHCGRLRVPIKFTAGLHHPFMHYDQGLASNMHGFFNVFFASMLARLQQVSVEQLILILENPGEGIEIESDRITWLGHQLRLSEIVEARRDHSISFGSCSFLEPIESMRSMGWI